MTQTFSAVHGIDYTLPAAPALTAPPLSLLDLATNLVDLEGLTNRLRTAVEKASSAQQRLSDLDGLITVASNALQTAQTTAEELTDEERDQPGAMDAVEDARRALAQLQSEYDEVGAENLQAEALAGDLAKQLGDLSRWEHGFVYLPELSNAAAMETFEPDTGTAVTDTNLKNIGSNQAPAVNPFYWYDPWIVVARDDRSLFGWPHSDFEERAQRAGRALIGHEAYQAEQEFWSGVRIPTNYHLSASPSTPTTSPHRTIQAFPNPTAAPGTVLGTPVGLAQSLAALDQAIAESDSGTGMIHATPYVMQQWMKVFPFIRDPSLAGVYSVNHNLLVPGYGYGGTGPDAPPLTGLTITTTANSNVVTSLTAVFTSSYIGRQITETAGSAAIPAGTYIVAVVNPNEVILSNAATSSHNVTASVAGQGGRAGGGPQEWAYATEMVYTLRGDINTYPYDLREGGPLVTVDNSTDVRSERSWATITNRFLRAAVLIDTTTL